ncbi:hypothetical protein GCM10010441_12980 [Kitasatospora paracochleata]|uniref:non-specific serine/threonine protein kinase n=1 Tax=Kitasatospora paracochleata TaxID=58354 RepID=A0ABT1JAX0_9ACTN|nr:serine/threonine-protein kinase [Kitasatospora paracochleata]MCP2314600.1 serine/threonine-protein kinase [Kitasatospora paracochleata]
MWGQGTVLGGRYTLVERLGGGAMGDVWQATDGVLERRVAVKILLPTLLDDPRFARRFRREATIVAGLSHPGIVDVYDYGEAEIETETGSGSRVAYIVMELIDGRPLNEVLAERGPLPVAETLELAAQVADALHTAHRAGVVHRDLKPANLMLRRDGRIAVTDFGIARSASGTRITATHAVMGTALYVAPEQVENGEITAACDLYSLGVVCFEMLTGAPPFTGGAVLEVVLKHVREPAPPLPDSFSVAVREFVAQALAKRPVDRFPDATVMAAEARAALAAGGGGSDRTLRLGAPVVAEASAAAEVPAVGPDSASAVEPVPPPVAAEPKAEPGGAVGATAPDGKRSRWRGRRVLVPLIVPVVISVGAGTVWLVQTLPYRFDGSGPRAGASAPASGVGPGGAAASPGGPGGSGTASPLVSGQPTASVGAGADAGQSAGTNPAGDTAVGGASGGGAAQGASVGGGSGGGTAPGPGPGQTRTTATPTPAPATTSPGESHPADCGGGRWGYLVNVGDGLKVGLAADSLADGTAVVMGGRTAYGWVRGPSDGVDMFSACKAGAPRLGKVGVGSGEGTVALGSAYPYAWDWKVVDAGGGASYLEDYLGQNCLTDNGAGRQLTVTPCAQGDNRQLFRVPA